MPESKNEIFENGIDQLSAVYRLRLKLPIRAYYRRTISPDSISFVDGLECPEHIMKNILTLHQNVFHND
jgi:hypothetical protein